MVIYQYSKNIQTKSIRTVDISHHELSEYLNIKPRTIEDQLFIVNAFCLTTFDNNDPNLNLRRFLYINKTSALFLSHPVDIVRS